MEDKHWEDHLKDLLGEYKPEGVQPDWDAFSDYMRVHDEVSEWEQDEVFDENIKESLTGFEAPPQEVGWNLVEASLNKADQQFDEHIRHRIQNFEPKYNPHTWPLLLRNLSGIGYLRTKLIAFKIVEVAAVFLLLFTVVKMGQMGKLPLDKSLFEYALSTGKDTLAKSGINGDDELHPIAQKDEDKKASVIDDAIINAEISNLSTFAISDTDESTLIEETSGAAINHNRRNSNSFN